MFLGVSEKGAFLSGKKTKETKVLSPQGTLLPAFECVWVRERAHTPTILEGVQEIPPISGT